MSRKTETKPEQSAEVASLRKEINKLQRQLTESKSRNQIIVEAIQDVYCDPPDLVIPSRPAPDRRAKKFHDNREIAVLHMSDVHVGKRTLSYNSSVAEDRMHKLIDKTLEITEARRTFAKIDEIHLYMGGDIIEGELIFSHQPHLIDGPVIMQAVKTAPAILTKAILRLAGNFSRLKVCGVPGNHGRNGGKHSNSHPGTNWDTVCYEIIKLMVCGSPSNPHTDLIERIEWDLPMGRDVDWFTVDRVFDWGNMVIHGHEIRGGFAGFPWYGVGRRAGGWKDSINWAWDYLYLGHFHTNATAELQGRHMLANGKFDSDDQHVLSNFAGAGCPSQRLAFYNQHHGLVSDAMVYLDERSPQLTRKYKR